jgi:hypothetical protein
VLNAAVCATVLSACNLSHACACSICMCVVWHTQ